MAYQARDKWGTVTLTGSSSSVAVVFPDPLPPNQTYVVVATPEHQTSYWITAKSRTGFTVNVGTTDVSDQEINWNAYMQN